MSTRFERVRVAIKGATPALLCIALTASKLWLVSAQTVAAVAPAPLDDELFLSQAESLLRGEWLGPPSASTLAKGPVYAFWLALVHESGLRLLLAQGLLYTLASAVLVLALRPALRGRWTGAAIYLALLWNPASWADGPATRVYRDGIYPSLTLFLLGAACGVLLRLPQGARRSAPWAAAAGLAGALLVMTREEGIWVLPSLAVLLVAALARARGVGLRRWLVAGGAAAAAYLLPTIVVATINSSRYGVFITSEVRSGHFRTAYGALTRVRSPNWHPQIPVPREARARIAAASPAYREIASALERTAPGWQVHGCTALGVCEDIAGGWFMWAVRDAATQSGKYESLPRAMEWYDRLASEVDEACRSGSLECLPPRASLMPPWRSEYLAPAARAFARGARFVATFESVTAVATRPSASALYLERYEAVTGERIPRDRVRFAIVVSSAVGAPRPVVVGADYRQAAAEIETAMVDAEPTRPGVAQYRLQALTACTRGCFLVSFFANGVVLPAPIDRTISKGGDDSASWRAEAFEEFPVPAPRSAVARLAVLDGITRAYALALPVLLLLGLAVLLRTGWRDARARTVRPLSFVALAMLAGVLARLLVLALVDATSFPAVNVQYAAPAYALAIAFVASVLAPRAAP